MKTIEPLSGDRLSIRVRVQTRASLDEIVGWTHSGELKLRVTAPPVDDAANTLVTKLLCKRLDVRRADVQIVSGAHSRSKRVALPASCENALLAFDNI